MPKTPAAEVEAGGRAVRVSSPDRVIYEATDRTVYVPYELFVGRLIDEIVAGPS